jgi:hypothetical protein
VLSLRTHDINVLSGSISIEKLQQFGKPKVWCSPKGHETDKNHDDKGGTYNVVPLDWGINNYDVYNRNGLIETIIFYTYIIFI